MTLVYTLMWASLAAFICLLLVNLFSLWRILSRRKKERKAIDKLVDQLKQQEKTRHEATGAFLEELYQLEGEELLKAIDTIDQSEKNFFSFLIQLYQNRLTEQLGSLDAKLAEVVDCYKHLKPKEMAAGGNQQDLQKENENLRNELEITRNTMSGMMAEFGNMFGGGQETRAEEDEVKNHLSIETEEETASAIASETDQPESPDSDAEALADEVLAAMDLAEDSTETHLPEGQANANDSDDSGLDSDSSEDDILAALGSIEPNNTSDQDK